MIGLATGGLLLGVFGWRPAVNLLLVIACLVLAGRSLRALGRRSQ